MKEFRPGFRLSTLDVFILIIGFIGVFVFLSVSKTISFIIAFVIGNFFLFCNVFRVSRPPELIWAALFVILGGLVEMFHLFNWFVTVGIMAVVTFIIVVMEMRKKSYHGIMWQKLNPNLENWFHGNLCDRKDN